MRKQHRPEPKFGQIARLWDRSGADGKPGSNHASWSEALAVPRGGQFLDPCLYVLVLYLERPPDNSAHLYVLLGRFGYSDLKEAAHMEAYVF
jgi:hypothetical protein